MNGTVNDVAVQGGRPVWLSAAFVIEEGFPVTALRGIVADMAAAAAAAGVAIVTGDTKVVGSGAADGIFVTTAGLGVIPTGRALGPELVRPGDNVIVSGNIGDHGMAVMLARGNLALEADIRSDTAPLNGLVEVAADGIPAHAVAARSHPRRRRHRLQRARPRRRRRRRAGRASPAREPAVVGACDLLGIDPLYVANEGKLVAVVAPDEADRAVKALRAQPGGQAATVIGEIAAEPEGIVVLRTTFGGTRIVDMLVGDPLPRIC